MFGMGTGVTLSLVSPKIVRQLNLMYEPQHSCRSAYMPVVNFMVKPNGLLVPVSFIHYCTSTSGLSTW